MDTENMNMISSKRFWCIKNSESFLRAFWTQYFNISVVNRLNTFFLLIFWTDNLYLVMWKPRIWSHLYHHLWGQKTLLHFIFKSFSFFCARNSIFCLKLPYIPTSHWFYWSQTSVNIHWKKSYPWDYPFWPWFKKKIYIQNQHTLIFY